MASSSSHSSEGKKVVLISSDEESFEVSEAAALLSVTVKNILEDADDGAAAGISLRNVDSTTLRKVLGFCNRHAAGESEGGETLKEFNKKFVEPLTTEDFYDLILAANYLNIKGLLDLLTETIADNIKDMSAEDCRDYFGITETGFTEEEEQEARKGIEWALDLNPHPTSASTSTLTPEAHLSGLSIS